MHVASWRSLDCTRLRQRYKTGPKGVRAITLERVKAKRQSNIRTWTSEQRSHSLDDPASNNSPSVSQRGKQLYLFNIDVLRPYLDIYRHKMYPVWPIVDVAALMQRLSTAELEPEAYTLASSVCLATTLQLGLDVEGNESMMSNPQLIVDEIEDLRRAQRYRQHVNLDAMSTSFFLHVIHLQIDHLSASTLLLREAISMAHIAALHNVAHYIDLPPWEVQDHLRKLWLLFITERCNRPSLSQITLCSIADYFQGSCDPI